MTPNEFRREFMSTTRAMQNSVHKTMLPICQDHGLTPRPVLTGLGELPGVRAVFVRHARDSQDDLLKQ